jgi:hypothetical protein
MQVLWRAQRFDRQDVVSVRLHGEHQAGADRLSIEQDRARAAYAMLTADVCAGQAKLVAQEIAQQQAWLDGAFVWSAINGNGQGE